MNIRLKTKIIERGLSQLKVARDTGVSDSYLSKVINGWVDPSKDMKAKLARGHQGGRSCRACLKPVPMAGRNRQDELDVVGGRDSLSCKEIFVDQDTMIIPSFSADRFSLVSWLEKYISELILFFRWTAEAR
jgi:hypothetical protein